MLVCVQGHVCMWGLVHMYTCYHRRTSGKFSYMPSTFFFFCDKDFIGLRLSKWPRVGNQVFCLFLLLHLDYKNIPPCPSFLWVNSEWLHTTILVCQASFLLTECLLEKHQKVKVKIPKLQEHSTQSEMFSSTGIISPWHLHDYKYIIFHLNGCKYRC